MSGTADKVKTYLSRHWFKLGLALLLIFIILKKDLSFQIDLRSPVKVENPADRPTQPVQEKPKPEERITETLPASAKTLTETPPPVDRFEFPSIGGGRSTSATPFEELAQVDEETQRAFLKRFTHVAEAEQRKYGIPASVSLANSLLLSRAGERSMARQGHNFFALPCTEDWRGDSGTYHGNCYRHYENAWTSFRDHSLYLTTGRLAPLRQKAGRSYQAWAEGLEKAGFGEGKDYARQLIRVVEAFQLQQLDVP